LASEIQKEGDIMGFKLAAVSDTHLGEPNSLLHSSDGKKRLVEQFRSLAGLTPDQKLEVDDLVLAGDIVDRTLSAGGEITDDTSGLFSTLDDMHVAHRITLLHGNHDHTMWTKYRRSRFGSGRHYITKPEGDLLLDRGEFPQDERSIRALLEMFFGFPVGPAWNVLADRKADFALANPIYVKTMFGRTYVFTHGTHFRKDVTSPSQLRSMLDRSDLLSVLDGGFPPIYADLATIDSLREIERVTAPLVDRIWASAGDDPTSARDKFWYLVTGVSHRFESGRNAPARSSIASQTELSENLKNGNLSEDGVIRPLTGPEGFKSDSLVRWEKYFLSPMLNYLDERRIPRQEITFVYGDTHEGGYGEYETFHAGMKSDIRIYNTGAWVADVKDKHPACHIFAVADDGKELLLDISFPKELVDKAYLKEENYSPALRATRGFLDKILSEYV
jgi:hypothetical protein